VDDTNRDLAISITSTYYSGESVTVLAYEPDTTDPESPIPVPPGLANMVNTTPQETVYKEDFSGLKEVQAWLDELINTYRVDSLTITSYQIQYSQYFDNTFYAALAVLTKRG